MAFSPENLKIVVNSREIHAFIQTATYPPFMKGTHGMTRRVKSVRTHVNTSADTGQVCSVPRNGERNNNGANMGKETSASMLPSSRTEPPPESPHAPILPLSHRTQQERKKRAREPGPRKQAGRRTETHTRAEAGKKCMPGQRGGQRRVEERVRSDEATKETGGSQQPSKRHAQGRGHGKHTASTTPQQSTREGGTRGTDEGQHHAPRHAPYRHHTHRAHPHPRPQHVASGPRQPAQRAGSGEGEAPEPKRPLPNPWPAAPDRARERRGQCRAPTPAQGTQSTWVADPDSPPGGRAVGGGGAPDLRRPSQR